MLSSFSRAIISSLAVMSATTQVVAAEIGANATTKVSDNSWIDMDTQAEATLPLGDQVGSGDKVKVTFVGNTDLTGEFRVQGDGTITLPVLGAFSVAGMTSGDIAKLITARFSQDARRSPNNQVVVDVTEWRPIFVTGGVSKPGAYTFMPGMTVLHAISQSGGLYRIADGDISTFINVAQNVSRMEEVLQRLKFSLVRVASLSAEREGQAEMKAPKLLLDIAGPDGIKTLMDAEKLSLKLRLQTQASEMDARRRDIDSTRQELDLHRKQLSEVNRQLTDKKQQLSALTAHMANGMVKRTDILVLETYVNDLESNVRDLTSICGRTERELSKAEQEFADLPLLRQVRIEEELSSLRNGIASDQATFEGARLIVNQLGNSQILQVYDNGGEPKRAFAIMRKVGGKDIFTSAGLDTRLQPGDVVVVNDQKTGAGAMLSAGGRGIPTLPELSGISPVKAPSTR